MLLDHCASPELQQCLEACNKRRQQAIALSVCGLLMLVSMRWLPAESTGPTLLAGQQVEYRWLHAVLLAPVLLASALAWGGFAFHRLRQRGHEQALATLNTALESQELPAVRHAVASIRQQAQKSPLIDSALQTLQPRLDQHLDTLTRRELRDRLENDVDNARSQCVQRLAHIKSRVPLVAAEVAVREALAGLQLRREDLSKQWDETYAKLSWWNKIKYCDGPDFSEIDQTIKQLKTMHERLLTQHAKDFERLETHFLTLKIRAEARIAASQQQIVQFIDRDVTRDQEESLPLRAALWLSALSVPISIWSDIAAAGNIYDALRVVNGKYADMSDAEIWWDTLFMPAEKLAGLASLAKGAYFEQLVAADTDGILFEHFNNPGTDLIIDGQAFQLKATSSAAYVNNVDEDIPIIATSEISEQTRALDSGYSNVELESSVDLALGGLIVDVKDIAVDALLAGVGGLGLFATVQGINHAGDRYKNGGDGVEAVFEGLSVAIEGTARALVGTAELGYKALASRPSRFVGRTLLSGLKKLDDKLFGG